MQTTTLPLANMSIEDKLSTMESLWDDLCRNNSDIPSPKWHGTVLAARQKSIEKGIEQYMDWEQAKRKIRAKIK
ncbi:MAG: hypothetical protein A2293_13105 [Elusimicrobia bacterium RIFOXYB2_FULL_49_7]|nr:MAG: hypothetical protein A2293_13105 [Elusimicrobia bacterium RIFOXYB2_FULL_49_7]